MKRRAFCGTLAGAVVSRPLAAGAQRSKKIPVVGFIHPGGPEVGSLVIDSLREGLREVGYVEGESITLEIRWAHGKPELLPGLIQELIQLGADVLVPTARPSIEAARAATTTLPIVANDLESDPIASGYTTSLARPSGNLTGVFLDAPTMCRKWLQQINDVVPRVAKVGVLWDVTTGTFQLEATRAGAKERSLNLVVMEFRDASELETALKRGVADDPDAIMQLGSPLIRQGAPLIAEMLSRHRIPAISQFRTYPDSGGLMSYGPDLAYLWRRISFQVSRVLRGARPADLPIERPTRFELVINMKSARTLGVTVPTVLLAAADEVIE
ncbi:MAG: ABC transporter substrate-binding protein [Reyranellaceae bacterium]